MSIREERKQQSRQAILDAALTLSTAERSFSSISLREISRHVGLVPTAFYRHFQDMDELGAELVDQVALHLKSILHQLGQAYLYLPNAKTRTSVELFFQAVDQHPQQWIFLIAERWGGSATVRQAIAREIEFLIDDFANDLKRVESVQHFEHPEDFKVLANILINLSFNWAMSWIGLSRQFEGEALSQQQHQFTEQTIIQVQLLFRGISHWERPSITMPETAALKNPL